MVYKYISLNYTGNTKDKNRYLLYLYLYLSIPKKNSNVIIYPVIPNLAPYSRIRVGTNHPLELMRPHPIRFQYKDQIYMSTFDMKSSEFTRLCPITEVQSKNRGPSATHGHISSMIKK